MRPSGQTHICRDSNSTHFKTQKSTMLQKNHSVPHFP
uniref:Uncharacterized protein n=1 Tax=Anguilla anguilla TaxID=7936 RepID=A0A0E9W4Z7_ANGAN